MASKVKRLDPDFGMSGARFAVASSLAEFGARNPEEDCDTFSKPEFPAEDKH